MNKVGEAAETLGLVCWKAFLGTILDAFLHKHLVMQGWAVLSWRLSGYLIILLEKTNFRVAVISLIYSRDLTSH